MRDANVVARMQSLSEQRNCPIQIVPLQRDIAKIRKGLRVIGVDSQLVLQLRFRAIILLLFPIQVAQPKMHARFLRSSLHGFLELSNRFWSPSKAVQCFSREDVSSRRVWVLLLDLAELLESAVIF